MPHFALILHNKLAAVDFKVSQCSRECRCLQENVTDETNLLQALHNEGIRLKLIAGASCSCSHGRHIARSRMLDYMYRGIISPCCVLLVIPHHVRGNDVRL